ncbi:MAG: MBL fold metallo-hydrolase [Candidatus Promineifilaceae bacterium]|nr:MBL fold metallo-hydrolase [Candidatus Promineifilaceae bacterium]
MIYAHLLVGSNASMLVDTGCAQNPEQDILPYMFSIGFAPADLTYILISHSDIDHQGGNAPMKEAAPQAILMCHELDRPWVEDTEALISGRYAQFEADHDIGYGEAGKQGIREGCLSYPLDMTLSGGERFRLDDEWYVEAVHTPGHTWGHLAVYDPRSKTFISGEASIWTSILDDDWQPLMPPTYCYVDTYIATQERMLSMDLAQLSPAHWPLQKGSEVKEFISESKNFCLHVENQLLDLAQELGSFTLREAIDTLGPRLGTWPEETNQDFGYGMLGNLDSLTKRGRLQTARNDEGLIIWSMPL